MSLRMTFPRLWAFLAVGLPVLGSLLANLSTVDLAYHVRAGAEILDARVIPSVDTWTFTASGSPWLDQQWAGQILFAGLHRVAGWTGLAIFRSALVGVIFTCLFLACRRRDLDLRRSAWLTIAAFVVVAAALALRPQLLGMALFAVTILLVSDRDQHPERLWAIPLIVLVWANVHGSFFFGPVVLGLAWLEDVHRGVARAWHLAVIGLLAVAAALINPFGLDAWRYAVGLSTNAVVTSRITEWQPTSLRSGPGILFFGSLAAVVVLIARRGTRVAWPTLIWIGLFAAIGTYAIRGVAWWSLGAILPVASLLAPVAAAARPPRAEQPTVLNGAVAAVIAIACLALLPIWRPLDARIGAPAGVLGEAPAGITESLRASTVAGDRILNPQAWGSWFEFAVPAATYAADSRIELYSAATWSDFERARNGGDGWLDVITRWSVTTVVTDDTEGTFVDRLQAAGWAVTYEDADGAILRSPATSARAAVGTPTP